MNALIRKFRVASTTGVVMSLAIAGVLAMAPMGNAMANSYRCNDSHHPQPGKPTPAKPCVTVEGTSRESGREAYDKWANKAYTVCGRGKRGEFIDFKMYQVIHDSTLIGGKKDRDGFYRLKTVNKCLFKHK